MKIADLLKEQELIEAKYFAEVEEGFIIPVYEGEDTSYLSEQICKRYTEMSNALKRYLQIDDILNEVYAKTFIQVLEYKISMTTGLRLLKDLGSENVERDPATGKLFVKTHPLGIFLNMCSVPFKYVYSAQPIEYLDPLRLSDSIVIEDVLYKLEEFLIQLKHAVDKAIYETEV